MIKCKNCNSNIPNERKFCNSSCSAIYNNKKYPKRTNDRVKPKCLNCDVQLNDYRRKYCSNKCSGEHKTTLRFEFIERNEFHLLGNKATIDRVTKKYLIKKYGDKCMKCSWNKINQWTNKIPIELNHIDGNPNNHLLSNVELLCPNCHSLSEFTKSRGGGRKWRKTVFIK